MICFILLLLLSEALASLSPLIKPAIEGVVTIPLSRRPGGKPVKRLARQGSDCDNCTETIYDVGKDGYFAQGNVLEEAKARHLTDKSSSNWEPTAGGPSPG